MMFPAHVAIQYLFCMQLVIEKVTLKGFTSIGEAKYGGKAKNTYNHIFLIKKTYFGHNSTNIARERTIFCTRGLFYMFYRSGMVPGLGELSNEGLTMIFGFLFNVIFVAKFDIIVKCPTL